jgi:hypothetical protein
MDALGWLQVSAGIQVRLSRRGVDDGSHIFRHPVTNEYLPRQLHGEVILRREGDLGDKLWDEEALRRWEEVENGGREWVGRPISTA